MNPSIILRVIVIQIMLLILLVGFHQVSGVSIRGLDFIIVLMVPVLCTVFTRLSVK